MGNKTGAKDQDLRVNRGIKAKVIRVIDDESNNHGEMNFFDALDLARSKNLDLVEVSPSAKPPVCKILDYGKFKYQQQKKHKEQVKNSKNNETKEIKLRPVTGEHDLEIKANKISAFLEKGLQTKITMEFKNREFQHKEKGLEIFKDFVSNLPEHRVISPLKVEDRKIFITIGN